MAGEPRTAPELSIGRIDYANCTPIFHLLQRSDPMPYRFVYGVPAQLNAMLCRGEIDVCPSSSIIYARSSEKFVILPDLSISACGPVKSVLLLSRRPLEELRGVDIALTAESETSVVLLKILLSRMQCHGNRFYRMEAGSPLSEPPEAFLLIGDAALKAAATPGYLVYDLGELWREHTGLPFVFALWLARREIAESRREELESLHRALLDAKGRVLHSLEEIAGAVAEKDWMGYEELVEYWKVLSYDLSPAHLEGLRTFYRYAAELGAVPTATEPRLFSCGSSG